MKAKIKKVKVYRLNTFQAAIKSTGQVVPIVSHETSVCFNYNMATNECIPECKQCRYKGNVEQCRYDSVTAWLKRRCKI